MSFSRLNIPWWYIGGNSIQKITISVIFKILVEGMKFIVLHKYRIWNEFSFHTVFMKQVMCFYIPEPLVRDIKRTKSFINTVWNENSFQILFITLNSQKGKKNTGLSSLIIYFTAENAPTSGRYRKHGIFRVGVIFAFFWLLSSWKLPPHKNKTHMPLWRK